MYWPKLEREEVVKRVEKALGENLNFDTDQILGLPGSYLDTTEFYRDASFLEKAPYLSTLINNPNHIGCHTLNKEKSERIFHGTQKIEIDVLETVSEQVLKAEKDSCDGYIAPGGTEANIQAMWIYRNYFARNLNLKYDEIAVVYSEDSHYSMPKGANLLGIKQIRVGVDRFDRSIDMNDLDMKIGNAKLEGVKAFVIVMNMSTTMFGSVDDIDGVTQYFLDHDLTFKIHIDGAFGGFIYPFTNPDNRMDFRNEYVTSVTLDAHKMLQSPYGTGIFVIRKGWMNYAATPEAQYVPGSDFTICGSRSGANAISIYLILSHYGSEGWTSKIKGIQSRTDQLCERLDELEVKYFRNPFMNIVSIYGNEVPEELATKYRLVADTYNGEVNWWKIVVMDHVKAKLINDFLNELTEYKRS